MFRLNVVLFSVFCFQTTFAKICKEHLGKFSRVLCVATYNNVLNDVISAPDSTYPWKSILK